MGYKRQKTLSRFYANDKATPEAISADIGPAKLALMDGPRAVNASEREGVDDVSQLKDKPAPQKAIGGPEKMLAIKDSEPELLPYNSNSVNFY